MTNPPRPLRASLSQNNPVNCCFLDNRKPEVPVPEMTWPQSKRENPNVLVIEHRSRGVQKMMGTRRVICDSSHRFRAGSVVCYLGGRYGSPAPLGFLLLPKRAGLPPPPL